MPEDLLINVPGTLAEVVAAFSRYEAALTGNDVVVLDELFWNSPCTVRYGATENLVGYEAIQSFRKGRSPIGLKRNLKNTVITTFGDCYATASTEFVRGGDDMGHRSIVPRGPIAQAWIAAIWGLGRVFCACMVLVPPRWL